MPVTRASYPTTPPAHGSHWSYYLKVAGAVWLVACTLSLVYVVVRDCERRRAARREARRVREREHVE
jgi:hypothetical protein